MFAFWKKSTDGAGEKSRKPWLVLLGAALGVLLLLFGSGSSLTGTGGKTAEASESKKNEIVEYQAHLEERVEELCESVAGVGNVSAVVTLAGGFELVYATELHGEDEDYVILGSGSAASGLLLQQKAPQIVGIGIVCSGAQSDAVRNELILLVSASFDLPTNRIYVAQAKK